MLVVVVVVVVMVVRYSTVWYVSNSVYSLNIVLELSAIVLIA